MHILFEFLTALLILHIRLNFDCLLDSLYEWIGVKYSTIYYHNGFDSYNIFSFGYVFIMIYVFFFALHCHFNKRLNYCMQHSKHFYCFYYGDHQIVFIRFKIKYETSSTTFLCHYKIYSIYFIFFVCWSPSSHTKKKRVSRSFLFYIPFVFN